MLKIVVKSELPVQVRCYPNTKKASEWAKSQNKEVWATLDGKDAALARLASRVGKRQGAHITERVALTDGAEALQKRVLLHHPGFTLVLDFIHANEYLWDTANRLFKEKDPKRDTWVEKRTLDLLCGHTEQVVADLPGLTQAPRTTKAQQEQLNTTANYFERNLDYMHYDEYLAKGWPIASGVIEGACRHLVKDRLELNAGPRKGLKTSCISGLSPKTMTGTTTTHFAGNKDISASTLRHTPHKNHWNIWRLIQPRNHLASSYSPRPLRVNTNSLAPGKRDLRLKRNTRE